MAKILRWWQVCKLVFNPFRIQINIVDIMFYLTDTGRRWDGHRVSIRDKMPQQAAWIKQGLVFRSTDDIITAARSGTLPPRIMMTFHPQRWTDGRISWLREMIVQNVKNVVKGMIVRRR
jgi:hypothetical protein